MTYTTWRDIPPEEYPVIVFADNNSDFVNSAIKVRTGANYSHVMWMIEPGIMASQGFMKYAKVPIEKYLNTSERMKFIGISGVNDKGRQAIIDSIYKKLNGPWYRKMYDWLGIFGQLVGLPWIQTPFFDYCSEDQPYHLQDAMRMAPSEFSIPLTFVINNLPKNGSPGVLDVYYHEHRDVFPLFGKWEGDEDEKFVQV